jgi:hypothetical protein
MMEAPTPERRAGYEDRQDGLLFAAKAEAVVVRIALKLKPMGEVARAAEANGAWPILRACVDAAFANQMLDSSSPSSTMLKFHQG